MSYQHMMVFLDDSNQSLERLRFALKLAIAHKAHLTGVHLSSTPFDPKSKYAGLQTLLKEYQTYLESAQYEAKAEFSDLAKFAGVSNHWLAGTTYDESAAIAYARSTDLVIAGQYDLDESTDHLDNHFIGRLLLKAGRPILLTHRLEALNSEFTNILIAWDGSRHAARAVTDALPFLKHAKRIHVLMVNSGAEKMVQSSIPRPDIIQYLHRHQIEADLIQNTSVSNVTEWLLTRSECLDLDADLIVAGAGGSMLMHELVLGGVTRNLLHQSTIPMLMSH